MVVVHSPSSSLVSAERIQLQDEALQPGSELEGVGEGEQGEQAPAHPVHPGLPVSHESPRAHGGDDDEVQHIQVSTGERKLRFGAKTFLLVLCLFVFTQSATTIGLIGAVVSTIEQRYGFSSTKSGLMFSVYDIAVICVIVPLSFHGGRYHKPRVLGLGWFVFGLGALLFALPQLLSGQYHASVGSTGYCSPLNVEDCGGADTDLYFVFLFAQIVIGLGAATLYTLGPSYLDANLPNDKVPLYLGVMYCVAALGPAFGFLVGGSTLDLYVDPGTDTALTPSDSQWVGAWWLMFVILGGVAVLGAPLFLLFPPAMLATKWASTTTQLDLMGAHNGNGINDNNEGGGGGRDRDGSGGGGGGGGGQRRASSEQQEGVAEGAEDRRGAALRRSLSRRFDGSIAEPPKSMYQGVMEVLRNPVWVTNALGSAGEALMVASFSAFLPKILQSQFALTSSRAAFLTGVVIIPGAAGGTFGGGAIVKYFRLSFIQTTRLCVLFAWVSMCLCGMFLVGCDEAKVVGVNQHYAESNAQQEPYDIHSACNTDCACVEQDYDPVCGSDERTYLNACLAGCRFHNTTSTYSECACVGGEATAKGGPCPAPGDCDSTLSAFLGLLFLLMLTTFANNTPATVVQLRVLGDEVAPVGLSLHSVMFRVLGTIPGPILFGALLDTTCEVKSKGCGRDSCELYDPAAMRSIAASMAFVGKGVSALMFTLSWRLAARKLEEAKRRGSPPHNSAL